MGRNYVCGDMHKIERDTKKINTFYFPEQQSLTKEDVVFQLGDFGWLWHRPGIDKIVDYWLEYLGTRNFTLAVILGNHENYELLSFLPTQKKWGGTVSVLTQGEGTIYFLKRGGVYTINGQKILAIGGAESIDKGNRIPYVSWWPEEKLSYGEINECLIELKSHDNKVDIVLSHTCPSAKAAFFRKDVANIGEMCSVSRFLDHVDHLVDFSKWHFAHLHVDKSTLDGVYTCHIKCPPQEITINSSPVEYVALNKDIIGESYFGLPIYSIKDSYHCIRASDIKELSFLSEQWAERSFGSTVLMDEKYGVMVYIYDWEDFCRDFIVKPSDVKYEFIKNKKGKK